MYWYGSEPRLCLTETNMIKELLSSKYVQITGRSWLQQQGSKHFVGQGLLMANGHSWFHQRRIVSPAFMADRLKVRDPLCVISISLFERVNLLFVPTRLTAT